MARVGRKPGSPKTGGRKKGTPNKSTSDVREAIARFAEGNVHRLQTWLDAVAENDPEKAANLYVRVIEYHIPKLARKEVEHSGEVNVGGLVIADG